MLLSIFPAVDRGQTVSRLSATPSTPPCPKCGGRQKLIGFMPHEHDPKFRVELYRCQSCGQKSNRTVRAQEATPRPPPTILAPPRHRPAGPVHARRTG